MNKNNFIFSPFFIYIFGFLSLFLVYSLKWSDIYPESSSSLLFFILLSSLIMGLIGFIFYVKKFFIYKPSITSTRKLKKWTIFYLIANFLDILYSRRIPLLEGLSSDENSSIDSFGIPIFHVFVLGFGAFLSLMIFYKIISVKKNRKILFLFFLFSFLAPIIIYGRGIIFMTLTGCLFIYLFSIKQLKKKIIPLIITILVGLFFFGVLGDIRVGAKDSRFGNQKNGLSIMTIANATPHFQESIIPHEYMWSYIYIVSPIGNLQYNINQNHFFTYSLESFWELFSNEMISETIGKRISGIEKRKEDLVIPVLNVSTVYARSYVILGWVGIWLMFMYTLLYIFISLCISSYNSEYFIVTIAILNITLLFNLFDNMFTYGGYANVIFIPLLLSLPDFLKKLKLKLNGKS